MFKMYPTCDNDCTVRGWKLYEVVIGGSDLLVSVPPGTDLDDTVYGFCHDEQEMLKIQGHLGRWTFINE